MDEQVKGLPHPSEIGKALLPDGWTEVIASREVRAMARVEDALGGLTKDEIRSVLRWARERFIFRTGS